MEVLSQPATVTERTLPCIEPQSLKRNALELINKLTNTNTDVKDAIVLITGRVEKCIKRMCPRGVI